MDQMVNCLYCPVNMKRSDMIIHTKAAHPKLFSETKKTQCRFCFNFLLNKQLEAHILYECQTGLQAIRFREKVAAAEKANDEDDEHEAAAEAADN